MLRRIVILFAALAFIATSVGWTVAGALPGLDPGHDDVTTSTAGDHHADKAAQCAEADECGDKTGHKEMADSCCGSTCHIGTQVGACGQVLVPMARAVKLTTPEDDITGASPSRLERPPRSRLG